MYQKSFTCGTQVITPFLRDTQDEAIFFEIFLKQEYQSCIPFIQKAQHCIIDCGAHIGAFCFLVRSFNSSVPVFAFEAHNQNFYLLQKNTQDLGVSTFLQAVAATCGKQQLHLSKKNQNHSLTSPFFPQQSSIFVSAINLESIFKQHKITQCDVIKMDIEGTEFEIIKNLPASIFVRTNIFCLEYHEHDHWKKNDLIEIFKQNGFSVIMEKQSPYQKNMGIIIAKNLASFNP